MSKRVGIIGGLGPMATVCLTKLLDDLDIVIINDPTTPDRTSYILGDSTEDPTNNILNMIEKLESQNVDIISMPCNTASYFYDKIKENINCEFVNIVTETVKKIHDLGANKVGLLATDGTIKSEIYKQEFEKESIDMITPSAETQKKVMSVIYDEVKASKKVSVDKLKYAINELKAAGAQKIVLGCTELSVVYGQGLINDECLVDSLVVLADEIKKRARN